MNDEARVAEIVAGCRERMARGEAVDLDSVVRDHPDLAAALRPRFVSLRRLDHAFAPAAPTSPSRVGTTLGAWRLVAELGSGGMGTVYLAEDGTRRVALKVVHPHLLARPGYAERFRREARVGRGVVHPNVVRTLDAGESTDAVGAPVHFLVMEHVEGRSLRALLDDLGRVPEELCRHLGREVAKALAAIHAAGVVHRDLKPDNVLVTPAHTVKVTDLGVARVEDDALRISQTGAFVGSVRYGAPEQFGGGNAGVDGRADLYALGLTLYELAAGRHPFDGEDFRVLVRKQMTETPQPAGAVNPQISPFFEDVLRRLLEKDRDQRFASAAEVLDVLEQGEASAWWKEREKQIRESTRRPLRRMRIPRETALYGRDAEMAKLRALFEKAKAGDGQVALVEGEAGIGKSRLIDEFVGQLAASGEDVNFLFGSYPPGGAATASGAFSVAYREQFGDAGSAPWLGETPILVRAFDALLRGEPPPPGAEPLTKDSIQTVFVHATRALAARRPTVVLIDDLHFAPEEGRALFAALALAVPGHRVLLIGAARPTLDAAWTSQLERLPHATRNSVPRLGAKDLVLLLRDSLKSEHLAEELGTKIAVKSDGNPFFVFEILRGLREGQFLTRRPDGTWATTKLIAEIQVPSSLVELVQARVSDLGPDDRNVLEVAACVGFEFDPSLVGDVLRMERIPLLQRLGRIEKTHRLVRSAGRRFVFDHHQVMEVLYAGLSDPLREEYHAAIGTAIESRSGAAAREPNDLGGALCIDLAEHFLKGAQGVRAIRYLGPGLTHLELNNLNEASVRLADRVLATDGLIAGRARCALLLRQAGRFDVLGRRDRQSAALSEANVLADEDGDDALRLRARLALGWMLRRLSRSDEAKTAIEEALALARAAGSRTEEAAALSNLGSLYWSLGRLADARELLERARAIARELGDGRGESIATGNLGLVAFGLGRFDEARELHERDAAISRGRGDRRAEAAATGNLGNVCFAQGRLDSARELHERHLALAREIGDRLSEATATLNLGSVSWSLGRAGESRECFERALRLAEEIGDRQGECHATVNLGSVVESMGFPDQARELVERSLAISHAIGYRRGGGYALQSLADLARGSRDDATAERLYAEALATRRDLGQRDGVAETLRARGALFVTQGRTADARADLDAALAIAREIDLPSIAVLASAWLARLPGADAASAAAAVAAHQERAGVGSAMEARFVLWQATRNRAHLAEAKRLLHDLVASAPAACRASMLANVPLHRDIANAAAEGAGAPPARAAPD